MLLSGSRHIARSKKNLYFTRLIQDGSACPNALMVRTRSTTGGCE